MTLLEIENLNVFYEMKSKTVHAIRNLSIKMEEGGDRPKGLQEEEMQG